MHSHPQSLQHQLQRPLSPAPCTLPGKQYPWVPCPGQSSLLEGWSGRRELQPAPCNASLPSQPGSCSPAPHHLAAQAWKLSPRVAKQLSATDPLARALPLPDVLPLSKEFIV